MSFSNWYRTPHTTAERRENLFVQRDESIVEATGRVVTVRPKRSTGLPNAWDDIPRCVQKSWKVQRKTQYHLVDAKGRSTPNFKLEV